MRVSFTGKISKQLLVVPLAPRFCKQHLLLQMQNPGSCRLYQMHARKTCLSCSILSDEKKKKKMALYFNQKIFSVSHGNGQHHCYSQWAWFQSFIRSPNSSGSKSGTIGSVSRQSATASLSWHGLWIRFLLLALLTSVKYKQNRVLRSSRVHFVIATQIVLCPTIVPNWWTSFFENLRVKMSYRERHP